MFCVYLKEVGGNYGFCEILIVVFCGECSGGVGCDVILW